MRFIIEDRIFERYTDVVVGALIAHDLDNITGNQQIAELTRAQEKEILKQYRAEALSSEPQINSWREIYRSFGVKPGDARSSVESLYRLVLRGIELRTINPLVDIYNLISLKYMVPVGGEDIDKMVGDLRLTIAQDEKAVKLLGDAEPEAPADGEVIYKDDDSTICRRWNWREADRTKLMPETQNAILVIEGIPPMERKEIESAVDELAEIVKKYCGGSTEKFILDKSDRAINF